MLKLLKNAELYTPGRAGAADILIAGGKIAAVGGGLRCFEGLPHVETVDLRGAAAVPGFVDLHAHITGGGGERGPVSRVPELPLSRLTLSGVTTVLGLLGTDGVTRSQENLLAKARALSAEGVTAFTLAGSYGYPSQTATGGVGRDIALIEQVVGVKVALADSRSSSMTAEELARLGSEARLGGMLAGKAGIAVIHMGEKPGGLGLLFEVLESFDVPPSVFLPTHCERSARLTAQAAEFVKLGGAADFTAEPDNPGGGVKMLVDAMALGADPGRLTVSSDAGGSLPRFDAEGRCTGMDVASPESLMRELARLTREFAMPLEKALLPFTQNPARVLGLGGVKGEICAGADADIVCLDGEMRVTRVYARGRLMVEDGRAVVKGMFE